MRFVQQRALQRGGDVFGGDRFHHVHAAARQQRRIQLEGRVFGGRANEQDGAALDMRQERILLVFVETMHLVHEQHRAPTFRKTMRSFGQHHAHFGQAGEHRGDRLEFGVGVLGQQQRERGLAAAGRPPQDHRMRVPGFDRLAQRRARREQPTLADHIVERARAHPFC